jgi:cytochrome c oxidase subunit 4
MVHRIPVKHYLAVFAALMALLALTVGAALLDLGRAGLAVAMGIAFIKAIIIALYFMHVKYSTRLTWAFVLGGLVWLGIMFTLTFSDYFTRGEASGFTGF